MFDNLRKFEEVLRKYNEIQNKYLQTINKLLLAIQIINKIDRYYPYILKEVATKEELIELWEEFKS